MKENFNTKTIHRTLPLLGLALLLLLSPCKVRNFIEAELNVPLTEVSNKSQTTFSNLDCSELELAANNLAQEKTSSEYSYTAVLDFYSPFVTSNFSNNYTQPHNSRNHSGSTIPLYILYQNFKDYL
ncbi:hypothetical protein APS56_05450 [Pseudalgibacter alginicilyticus]|uniref:Uncharacterized protein n=1 Tax=Pseudalgibacter alginicilyticus TaxID=1736674 RepID=A0A0P0D175_9FLAO|nr:hypothetical protein [Pseudalgibacter alginicilyticus]ALJ04616.1 hypothetical protein APS56_05450 [Pseudalgibacter alginicilyticus]